MSSSFTWVFQFFFCIFIITQLSNYCECAKDKDTKKSSFLARRAASNKPLKDRTVQDWMTLGREVLFLYCNSNNIAVSGTRTQLAERLVAHFNSPSVTTSNVNSQQFSSNEGLGYHVNVVSSIQQYHQPAPVVAGSHAGSFFPNPAMSFQGVFRNPTPVGQTIISQSAYSSAVQSNNLPTAGTRTTMSTSNQHLESVRPRNSSTVTENTSCFQVLDEAALTDYINTQIQQAISAVQIPQPSGAQAVGLNETRTSFHQPIRPVVPQHPSQRLPAVPPNVLDRVYRGEFINFNDLLPPSVSSISSSSDYQIQFNSSSANPTINVIPNDQHKAKVIDFVSWSIAWSAFMQIMFVYHNQLIGQLLSYQNLICQFASQYAFANVYAYDQAFRQLIANNPRAMSWDKVDDNLFNSFLRGAPPRQDIFCFKCKRKGHYSQHCFVKQVANSNVTYHQGSSTSSSVPSNFRLPQVTPNSISSVQSTCNFFNKGKCTVVQCRYLHKCSICNKVTHGAANCPSRST